MLKDCSWEDLNVNNIKTSPDCKTIGENEDFCGKYSDP